jgi:hypothetical protein
LGARIREGDWEKSGMGENYVNTELPKPDSMTGFTHEENKNWTNIPTHATTTAYPDTVM